MKFKKHLFCLIFISIFASMQSHGAIDILMKLEDNSFIKNTSSFSQLKGFEDYIEITGASFGSSNTVDNSGANRSASRPDFTDVFISKKVDEITPILTLLTATGTQQPKITIVWVNTTEQNESGEKLMEFIMEDVIVSSSTFAASEGSDRGDESASFNWGKMTIQSYKIDSRTGKSTASTKTELDRVRNVFGQ